jgi:hypothetical protein
MSVKKLVVRQPEAPAEQVSAEVMAQAIVDIAKGMKALSASRLKRETIVILVHDQSKIAKGTIRVVLNNLEALEKEYLK